MQAREGFRIWIGIDPGVDGAVAAYDAEDGSIRAFKTPIIEPRRRKILGGAATKAEGKRTYDLPKMRELLTQLADADSVIAIEKQQSLGPAAYGGAYQEFGTGYGYGLWLGMAEMVMRPLILVRPQDWQASMIQNAEGKDTKEKSVFAATGLWPTETFFRGPKSRKPHHGMTDAALIAYYAWLTRKP